MLAQAIGMRCLYCGKSLGLLKELTDGEFCSGRHRQRYQKLGALALGQLIERPPDVAEFRKPPLTRLQGLRAFPSAPPLRPALSGWCAGLLAARGRHAAPSGIAAEADRHGIRPASREEASHPGARRLRVGCRQAGAGTSHGRLVRAATHAVGWAGAAGDGSSGTQRPLHRSPRYGQCFPLIAAGRGSGARVRRPSGCYPAGSGACARHVPLAG